MSACVFVYKYLDLIWNGTPTKEVCCVCILECIGGLSDDQLLSSISYVHVWNNYFNARVDARTRERFNPSLKPANGPNVRNFNEILWKVQARDNYEEYR